MSHPPKKATPLLASWPEDGAGRRILLVRLSALGDIIHALPVFYQLRQRWPAAKLSWIVEGRAHTFIEKLKGLDQVISLPRHWLLKPGIFFQLHREIRNNFDLVVDVQGLFKSAAIVKLTGSPIRIGFSAPGSRECASLAYTHTLTPTYSHVVQKNLQLLSLLDIYVNNNPDLEPTPQDVKFPLPEIPDGDSVNINTWLASLGLTKGHFAVINPGAGWLSKFWSVERYVAIIQYLLREYNMPCIVVHGTSNEKNLAEIIVASIENGCPDLLEQPGCFLAPNTTLEELLALLHQSALTIGSDTGPMHIAAATGNPCIGLFGPMNLERNGLFSPVAINIQKKRLLKDERKLRKTDTSAMVAITTSDVMAACDHILQSRKQI